MAKRGADMADGGLFSAFDEYDLKARLAPALIALVPPALLVLLWWPAVSSLGEGLVAAGLALILLIGLAFAIASQGVRLERKWGDAIGTPHSARLLSHSDTTLSGTEKAEIYRFFAGHGRPVPSAEEESQDALKTQECRVARVGWLITVSRPEAGPSLLLKENIAYGFWRNLRALKGPALALASACLILDLYLLSRAGREDPRFPVGVAVAIACVLLILFLVLLVTRKTVIQASLGYAKRLFSLRDDAKVVARAGGAAEPAPGTSEVAR